MWLALCAVLFVEVFRTGGEVSWPSGTYGLPKPKSGCLKYWADGWRKQDMEDDDDGKWINIPAGSNMDATVIPGSGNNKDIERRFCIKTTSGVTNSLWPIGSYCVYQYGSSCPTGMGSGSIKWDDENYENINGKSGTLPAGQYDRNTLIRYCCEKRGQWYNAIELPVDRPFYLLPRNSGSTPRCQLVKWAKTLLEYIRYDTENSNNGDKFEGDHVFYERYKNFRSTPQMYYCYYESCRHQLTTSSGHIDLVQTDNYPQFQYCSWLITVDVGNVVSLRFKDKLVFPDCDESSLKIYDSTQSTAPLITTICGSTAVTGTDVISTTNTMLLVLNAGSYAQKQGYFPEFHITYKVRAKPEQSFQFTAETGMIEWQSPRLPIFGAPRQYYWSITIATDRVVLLNFTQLQIPSCFHNTFVSLKIYGETSNASASAMTTLCGSNATDGVLVQSSSNKLHILLDTGGYFENPGQQVKFLAEYISRAKPGCRHQLTTSNGHIDLVQTDNYPQLQYCSWLITVDVGNVVSLRFSDKLVFPDCDESSLKIYDGTHSTTPLITTICGSTAVTGTDVISTTNTMLLVLNAGSYAQKQGNFPEFHITYKTAPPTLHAVKTTTNLTSHSNTTLTVEISPVKTINDSIKPSDDDEKSKIISAFFGGLACGLILVLTFCLGRRCLRMKKKGIGSSNNDEPVSPRYKIPALVVVPNDSVYQQLDLSKVGTEEQYQPLRKEVSEYDDVVYELPSR